MNKEKAIEILTEKLTKDLGISIVKDSRWKDELKEKSTYFNQQSNAFVAGHGYYHNITYNDSEEKEQTQTKGWRFVNSEQTQKNQYRIFNSLEEAIAAEKNCKGANYCFIDNLTTNNHSQSSHFFVTPLSIIGEKEINHLREQTYNKINPQIASAMRTLDINDYSNLYTLYSHDKLDEEFISRYKLYLKFLNAESNLVYNTTEKKAQVYYVEKYFNHTIKELNKIMSKILDKKSNIEPEGDWIRKGYLRFKKEEFEKYTPLKKYKDVLPDFLNFVFNMPYEDQNIAANKNLLQWIDSELNYLNILANEYSNGKHFQDYFQCLNNEQQQDVINCLKTMPEKNIANDSFLWSKGFKDVKLDYMDLYQNNADEFIEYFNSKQKKEKRIILKDIMNCDYTNNPVAEWLDENELDLVREVSMNG